MDYFNCSKMFNDVDLPGLSNSQCEHDESFNLPNKQNLDESLCGDMGYFQEVLDDSQKLDAFFF